MKTVDERIYVRSIYLRTAHYFFYALAVFSLTTTIIFWERYVIESVLFMGFCMFYIAVTVLLTYSFYRDYSSHVEGDVILRKFAPPYMALSILVVLMTEVFVIFVPTFESAITSMLFVNYFYFFVVIVSFIFYMMKPVRRLFVFQSVKILENAKNIASSRSRMPEIKHYSVGTDPIIDEALDDVWSHKREPRRQVRKLETEMCVYMITRIGKEIKAAKSKRKGIRVIRRLQEKREKYEHML